MDRTTDTPSKAITTKIAMQTNARMTSFATALIGPKISEIGSQPSASEDDDAAAVCIAFAMTDSWHLVSTVQFSMMFTLS